MVHGNQIMIQRAVEPGLSNAIRYCPRGRTVYVKVQRGADGATLSVGNPGRGIAKEHHAHLFERFYRVDKESSTKRGWHRSWLSYRSVNHDFASGFGKRGSYGSEFHLVSP